jgi:hypothetical protein
MNRNPLVPGRGVLGSEYADDLVEKIERTNCLKGCIHAERQDTYVDCAIGLLVAVCLSEGQPVPEFELHGNRYVICLMRKPPEREPEPPVDLGPDLFEAMS